MGPREGPDAKTNWPTDRRSQYDLNLNFREIRSCELGLETVQESGRRGKSAIGSRYEATVSENRRLYMCRS
jgi:hypothetical protein